VYYHPDSPEAASVETLVRDVALACERSEIPLYLEPLAYSPAEPGRPLPSHEHRRVVLEAARTLVPLGVDILKSEFPIDVFHETDEGPWREACQELTAASQVPWVLLSGGVSHELFLRQATIACETGASGIMAGRAIWNEAVTTDRFVRTEFLRTQGSERLRRLRAMADAVARPFWEPR
jgi:tagatose-1,6-bisphosphate aldolase